ncbi:MAG: hypothetical protein ACI8SE_001899 [Bacteroidia bacterium]|jgi:hypothetical protein
MKIRIKGDTIRLRLSQNEVDEIGNGNMVQEATHFGTSVFQYSLSTHSSDIKVISRFDNGEIYVSINSDEAKNWAQSDQVGIVSLTDSTPHILIEKDFQCLTVREGEDESDLFNNPNTTC